MLGGWLTESFGWPWVFAINPPLALAAVALLLRYAPRRSACDAPVRSRRRGDPGRRARRHGLGAEPDRPGKPGASRTMIAVAVVLGLAALVGLRILGARQRIR